ncbi:MAG: hypothetical protein AMXMBFR6_05660 [Betaproteobacteria bacterium]|nr:DUF4845 domain-containing protein [Rhodocyclaceae bacterium]MCG3186281.1 hypothetical protein [Rhodocyclaceae bacterium]
MKRNEAGLSLFGFILIAALIAGVAVIGMKVLPAVIEYYTIAKNVRAVIKSPETRDASVVDIRKAYDRRALIDDIKSVEGKDLEVLKSGRGVTISYAYSRTIPLFANASLVLDFQDTFSSD